MTGRGSQQGITIIDALITLCLIGILIGVVIPRYQRLTQEAQKAALKSELSNIRTSIKLFHMLNQRNPDSLREMLEKQVILPARIGEGLAGSVYKENYLLHQAVDDDGNILDAFGNRYVYDPARGEVKTTTEGYETW